MEVNKMSMYKYIREAWKSPKSGILKGSFRPNIPAMRKDETTVRVEKPTRLDKARSLGYKAKQGIFIVRQRVDRGGRMRPDIKGGRRSKHSGQRKDLKISYQVVAEMRVADKYPNCEILNSYYLAEDGKHYWYEVIVVDKNHPAIRNDPILKWIASTKHTNRVFRGLTSAAKRSRGLMNKGKGAEKIRPSLLANDSKAK